MARAARRAATLLLAIHRGLSEIRAAEGRGSMTSGLLSGSALQRFFRARTTAQWKIRASTFRLLEEKHPVAELQPEQDRYAFWILAPEMDG